MNLLCKIVLPLPDKKLNPNYNPASIGGRMAKARLAKKYRKLTSLVFLSEGLDGLPKEKVSVKPIYYHAQNRRRDIDNFMGALKSAYDGLVDGGLCKDDNWEIMKKEIPEFKIDKKSPRVELLIYC